MGIIENFEWKMPTQILFGKNQIQSICSVVESVGTSILLIGGNNAIRSNGIYEFLHNNLSDATIHELIGIGQNPDVSFVRKGVEICKNKRVDCIIAVGGGSVIDCAKAISVATCFDGDAWDMIKNNSIISNKIPLIVVLTNFGTGSEANSEAVISNNITKEKLTYCNPAMYPLCAIMDPSYISTVPYKHFACGVVDSICHVFEQYFVEETSLISRRLAVEVMKTIIEITQDLNKYNDNYSSYAELMWCSSIADNMLLTCGNTKSIYPVHAIEHELSARYGIIHGIGMAILLPKWMAFVFSMGFIKPLAKYGREVWEIRVSDDVQCAQCAIKKTEDFFSSLSMPKSLKDIGITEVDCDFLSSKIIEIDNLTDAYPPLDKSDVSEIIRMSC